jgi:hypothetical protein
MGWELADPLTFISDVMMAAVCLFCGHRLFHDFQDRYAKSFGLFFLLLGVSAFLGGSSHLLENYIGKPGHMMAWFIHGVSIIFVELACIRLIEKQNYQRVLRAITYGLFGFFIARLMSVQTFEVVKMNSTFGLIGFVFVIHLIKYFQTKVKRYLKVPLSIALFLFPAFIHGFSIYYNDWINQNVISHVLLLPCYYILYRSVREVARIQFQPLK